MFREQILKVTLVLIHMEIFKADLCALDLIREDMTTTLQVSSYLLSHSGALVWIILYAAAYQSFTLTGTLPILYYSIHLSTNIKKIRVFMFLLIFACMPYTKVKTYFETQSCTVIEGRGAYRESNKQCSNQLKRFR
ncbi:hypothetical protein AB4K20DRAFT_1870910 [Rhizopus microsporus]